MKKVFFNSRAHTVPRYAAELRAGIEKIDQWKDQAISNLIWLLYGVQIYSPH